MKVTEIETSAERLRAAIADVKSAEVHSKDSQEEILAELLEAGLALVLGMLVNIAAIREKMDERAAAQYESQKNFGFEVGVSNQGYEIKL